MKHQIFKKGRFVKFHDKSGAMIITKVKDSTLRRVIDKTEKVFRIPTSAIKVEKKAVLQLLHTIDNGETIQKYVKKTLTDDIIPTYLLALPSVIAKKAYRHVMQEKKPKR